MKEPPHNFPPLTEDIRTDVAIIGGGMAGILCAYQLQKANIDCVVLEANRIGGSVTARTTAVLSPQLEFLYQDMVGSVGRQAARSYLRATTEAIDEFRHIAQTIPCDWEEMPALTFSKTDRKKLLREVKLLRELGVEAEFAEHPQLPFSTAGGVVYPNTAQFHPLKFLYGIAPSLRIYENTKAVRIEDNTVITPQAHVHAKKVIVATHFPFINKHGRYFMKMYQRRSFVIAYENAPRLSCTAVDEADDGMYLRSYGDLLLVGGGDKRPGKKGGGFPVVQAFVRETLPQATAKCIWSNQDCITLDGLPYIGRYSKHTQDLYVITGFNEWGMASSMVGACILRDLLTRKKNPYADTFRPDRHMPLLPLLQNAGESTLGLLTPSTKRCSHLGCALHWNEEEGVWECGCHGSRFRANGTIIENPAMHNIQTKKS